MALEACIGERCGASARAQKYQPDESPGRVERVNTRGTCPLPSKTWANSLLSLNLQKLAVFCRWSEAWSCW
jgi:hypothetical protein